MYFCHISHFFCTVFKMYGLTLKHMLQQGIVSLWLNMLNTRAIVVGTFFHSFI